MPQEMVVTVVDARTRDVTACLDAGAATTIVVTSPDAGLAPLRDLLGHEVRAVLASGFSRAAFSAALWTVAAGGLYVDHTFVADVRVARSTAPASGVPGSPAAVLTSRETQVYAALCRAHSNTEIADELGISPRTIRFHVSNILRKLDLPGRNHVIAAQR